MSDIFTAIDKKEIGRIEQLCKEGLDKDARNKDGDSPLYYAIKNNKNKIAGVLIKKGKGDINSFNGLQKFTPLYIAIISNNLEIIKLLIEKGSNLRMNESNTSLIKVLIEHSNDNIIEYIIGNNIIDLNKKIPEYNTFPLFIALITKKIKLFNLMLNNGADPSIQEYSGNTILMYLLQLPNINTVDFNNLFNLLIKYKDNLNINALNTNKLNALYFAIKNHSIDIVKTILNLGTKLEDVENNLYQIIKVKDKAFIETLIPYINTSPEKIPFLIWSVFKNETFIFDSLITIDDFYTEVKFYEYKFTNIFNYSIFTNKIEFVRKLINMGIDINHKNNYGRQAIFSSINIEMSKYLLDNGADINSVNDMLETPIIHAITIHITPLVIFYLEQNADYNIKVKGMTLIEYAKSKDFNDIVKILEDFIDSKSNNMWKGFTKNDMNLFDGFFEDIENNSFCPICLAYSSRIDACRYMNHRCPETVGNKYHKDLYNMYRSDEGLIYWCTICGRICLGHRHFDLTIPTDKAKLAELRRSEDFFGGEKECIAAGGGGYKEKISRFHRLREYALELQEDINIKKETLARDELIEEVWKAPFFRSKKVDKIIKDKKWNISSNLFSNPEIIEEIVEINSSNIPNPNKEETTKKIFTEGEGKINSATMNDPSEENPLIQFIHKKSDGTINEHEGEYISVSSLNTLIQNLCKQFALHEFGHCWVNSGDNRCDAYLYPEDIKEFLPEDLYNEYKLKFNRKFKGKVMYGGKKSRKVYRGGNDMTEEEIPQILTELTNGQCVLRKTKKGGKRTRKNKV